MSEARVIRADYANWRPVAGRKVLQLVFEVPIEQTEQVMKMLGVPITGESRWCAIALLKPEAEGQANEVSGSTKDRKPFSSLPLSQQAAIRCQDKDFIEFMDDFYNLAGGDTAWGVRSYCGVDSRSKIVDGTGPGDMWRDLEKRYQRWLTDRQYAGVRR